MNLIIHFMFIEYFLKYSYENKTQHQLLKFHLKFIVNIALTEK